MTRIPIVDVTGLAGGEVSRRRVAARIGEACRRCGFFYVVGHGVREDLQGELERQARLFFARPPERKLEIRMARGGKAWRGYFPLGDELTSGLPDQKEGLYFGAELGDDHPKVASGTPLHGRNLFPADMPALRHAVLAYLDAMTELGHTLMRGIALSLGLAEDYFQERCTGEPTTLFRIFHYPPLSAAEAEQLWSVGEHTDYGLLTMLRQDRTGGLQVKMPTPAPGSWIDAPPVPGSFVCNLGDMLDRMTGGLYRSTPHRVRNRSDRGRLSFPFFFDPSFDAEVKPIDTGGAVVDDRERRWDGTSVHELRGTYGEYLLAKIGKVFPELGDEVL